MGEYSIIRDHHTKEELIACRNDVICSLHSMEQYGLFAEIHHKSYCGMASAPYFADHRLLLQEAQKNASLLAGAEFEMQQILISVSQDSSLQCSESDWKTQGVLLAAAEQYLKGQADSVQVEATIHRVQEDVAVWNRTDGRTENHYRLDNLELELRAQHRWGKKLTFSQALWLYPGIKEEAVYTFLDTVQRQFHDFCSGRSPEAGMVPCVLSPQVTGMLIHEAVGHMTEADGIQAGSALQGLLQQQIATESVSVVDFANHAFGQLVPIPLFHDHVGTEASDAVLIQKGRLYGYLHNADTAQEGEKLTGNARAESYRYPTMVRMRNTALLPGKESFAALLERVRDGYFLCTTAGGRANLSGSFSLKITLAYRILNGKLQYPITGCLASGNVLAVLQGVEGLSDTFEWVGNHLCSKGQLVPVAMGGPHMLCQMRIC